jgi:putative transcriptional regulator
VLVIGHNDEGAFGVILNRPTHRTLSQIWEEVGQAPCDSQQPVNLGGPVDGPMMAVHTHESHADIRVTSDVFVAVDRNNLDWVVRYDMNPHRVFVGTVSWEAGELESEIAQGDWLVLPASKEFVFSTPEEQWRRALRSFGRYFLSSLGIKHIPDDPTAN